MAGSPTFQQPLLLGVLLAAMTMMPLTAQSATAEGATALPSVLVTPTTTAATPCAAQPAQSEWLTVAATATEPARPVTPSVATPLPAGLAAHLRPTSLIDDNNGVAAATLAGATLMLLGGWRWYRSSRLPWPPEPGFEPDRIAQGEASADADIVLGWRLSRFDDLPDAEPVRPLRPLYDSLDDADVIDVEPLPPRH